MQRIRADQHVVEVAGLVQQAGEHGDLVRLAIHGDLGEHHPGAVIQAGHQVRRGPVARAGATYGLAIHREHHPPSRRPPGRQLRAHPPADRAVQRRRVHGGQHPPDGRQVRDGARQAQPRPQPRRGVGGPLGDRRVRPRPGQHRAHGHSQHRDQPIADPAPVPRVGYPRQRFQQPFRRRRREGRTAAAEQGKLATGQHGRRG